RPAPVPRQERSAEGPGWSGHQHRDHVQGRDDRCECAQARPGRRSSRCRGLRETKDMSRVAKKPIALPKGVALSVNEQQIQVKGPKGTLNGPRPAGVDVSIENGTVQLAARSDQDWAMAGTLRALLNNMVTGVSE